MLVTGIFVLLWLRRPDLLNNPQFWAEDGSIFFTSQLVHGYRTSIVSVYAGYWHLVPRLVAALATLFPPHSAPLIFNLAALAIDTLCCTLFALPCYRHLLKSDAMRVILCLFMATGIYADELVGTAVNAQWFMAVAMLLVLALPDDVENPIVYTSAVFCLAAGLSVGLGILLAPLAASKVWRTRNRKALPAAAMLLAATVQVCLVIWVPGPNRPNHLIDPAAVAASTAIAFDYRVVMSSLFGHYLAQKIMHHGWTALALATLAGTAVWIGALGWLSDGWRRKELAACVYLTIGSIALAMGPRGLAPDFADWSQLPPRHERYFFLGSCLFAYLIAVSIERWMARVPASSRVTALAVVLAGGMVGNFQIAPLVDYGWSESAGAVDKWLSDARAHRATQGVKIEINPSPYAVVLPGVAAR